MPTDQLSLTDRIGELKCTQKTLFDRIREGELRFSYPENSNCYPIAMPCIHCYLIATRERESSPSSTASPRWAVRLRQLSDKRTGWCEQTSHGGLQLQLNLHFCHPEQQWDSLQATGVCSPMMTAYLAKTKVKSSYRLSGASCIYFGRFCLKHDKSKRATRWSCFEDLGVGSTGSTVIQLWVQKEFGLLLHM